MRNPAIILLILLSCGAVLADGVVVPYYYFEEPQGPPEIRVTIDVHRVTVDIDGGLAVTEVYEEFVNRYDYSIEAVYLFPVPENAAVDRFSVIVDGREVTAEALPAEEAAELYTTALREGGRASLLEFMGRGAFRASLGVLEPGERLPVTISYSELLEPADGLYHYSYPLDIEAFTYDPVDELSIDVELRSEQPVLNVYSTSHAVEPRRTNDAVIVEYREQGARPDSDFELYYKTSTEELAASLLTDAAEDGGGGFLLVLTPQPEPRGGTLPKDIVFCFDISGSMRGEKLDQARSALQYCLERLDPRDRFEVIVFSTEVRGLFDGLVAADEDNLDRAVEFVGGLEAEARTNLDGALRAGLKLLDNDNERPRSLVFLTDGKPTVGVRDDVSIVDNVLELDSASRAYIFGVGHDLNAVLLDHLARVQRGAVVYVEPGEDLQAAITGFYEKIHGPVLTDLELDFGGAGAYDLYPPTPPDLFAGEQLTLAGRFAEPGVHTLTLSGNAGGETVLRDFKLDFGRENNDAVELIWARRKVGFLLEQIRLESEDENLVEQVEELALRYGIVTPYTSLAWAEAEPEAGYAVGDPAVNYTLHEAADGVGFGTSGALREGAGAVAESKAIDELQAGVGGRGSVGVRRALGRAFYLLDGVWTDSEYDEEAMQSEEIVQASDEFFELLGEHPEVAEALALGERVIVVLDGVAYSIVPAD